MGKKCVPGLICIENMTLVFSFVIFCGVVYLYYKNNPQQHQQQKHHHQEKQHHHYTPDVTVRQNIDYPDTLLNPYSPPMQDTRRGGG